MVDTHHHRLLESPAAMASSVDDEDFTFATAPRLAAARGESSLPDGPVYPVFGRPRSPPLLEDEDPASSATVRVPLGQLLLEERGSSSPGQRADCELRGAETYCLWSPGGSPAAIGSQSPARCQKSGSVLRWRQRLLGRSHSDGKDKFVYLNAISSERSADGGHHGRGAIAKGGDDGNGGRRSSTFLPCNNKDLVGLFANAGAFRRSYHPF